MNAEGESSFTLTLVSTSITVNLFESGNREREDGYKMSSSFLVKTLVKGWAEKAGKGTAASFFSKSFATQSVNSKLHQETTSSSSKSSLNPAAPRTLVDLTDAQISHLLQSGTISPHRLEADLGDPSRAVSLFEETLISPPSTAVSYSHPYFS